MVFAVATISTLFVYDTLHKYPLLRVAGCHLATINDVCWSSDGQMLTMCSTDGYLTFVRFPDHSLGKRKDSASVTIHSIYLNASYIISVRKTALGRYDIVGRDLMLCSFIVCNRCTSTCK